MCDLVCLSEQCKAPLFRMGFIRLAQEEADQVMKEGTLGVSEEKKEVFHEANDFGCPYAHTVDGCIDG